MHRTIIASKITRPPNPVVLPFTRCPPPRIHIDRSRCKGRTRVSVARVPGQCNAILSRATACTNYDERKQTSKRTILSERILTRKVWR